MASKPAKTHNPERSAPKKRRGGGVVRCGLFALAGAAAATAVFLARGEGFSRKQPAPPVSAARPTPSSYYDLLAMSLAELEKVDLAVVNLLCAKGLPGVESLDIPAVLARLDEWAAKVKAETQRHLYRVTDPRYADHYARSEARLRAEFLVQSLQEDCGVHYNLERLRQVDFTKPADLFIHGMVDSGNGGTCSSMPVLYAAVGRRLGYPIRLVLAKQHVFCRWDDGQERFNIEAATNGGIDYPPDEHYRTWPVAISDAEMQSGEFLKSLTSREELANFLLQRAACLQGHRRKAEERACLAEAAVLMPNSGTLETALRGTLTAGVAQQLPRLDKRGLSPEARALIPPDPAPGVPKPGIHLDFATPARSGPNQNRR